MEGFFRRKKQHFYSICGRRDESAIKSAYCSHRRPEFGSQHPPWAAAHKYAWNSSPRAPNKHPPLTWLCPFLLGFLEGGKPLLPPSPLQAPQAPQRWAPLHGHGVAESVPWILWRHLARSESTERTQGSQGGNCQAVR